MTDLQKEFEATGCTSWINADLYPDGKIYTKEYTQWLEKQVLALRQPPVSGMLPTDEEIINEAEGRHPVKTHNNPDDSPYVGTQKTFIHGVRWALAFVQGNYR